MTPDTKRHVNVVVSGDVQGVGFRYAAMRRARELGVRGFAENRDDGTVYLEAEGEPAALEQFITWCREGPSVAEVVHATFTEGDFKNFSSPFVAR